MLDTVSGLMARQVLLNVRIDPIVVHELLPTTFKPVLRHRYAIGGISLIRFDHLSAEILPHWMESHSESVAFWFVEWEFNGKKQTGAYIPRRESNSHMTRSLGDRPFTGIFRRSHFNSEESDLCIRTFVKSIDDTHEIEFHGHFENKMPKNSVFSTLEEAKAFLQSICLGYSESEIPGVYHGLELRAKDWNLEPLSIRNASSTFLDDRTLFPPGSLEIDSAFALRNVRHEWHHHGEVVSHPGLVRINTSISFTGLTSSLS